MIQSGEFIYSDCFTDLFAPFKMKNSVPILVEKEWKIIDPKELNSNLSGRYRT